MTGRHRPPGRARPDAPGNETVPDKGKTGFDTDCSPPTRARLAIDEGPPCADKAPKMMAPGKDTARKITGLTVEGRILVFGNEIALSRN